MHQNMFVILLPKVILLLEHQHYLYRCLILLTLEALRQPFSLEDADSRRKEIQVNTQPRSQGPVSLGTRLVNTVVY